MKPVYFLKEVYFALVANKVRSGLTVLGIVIGIASVISMLAIGQGSKDSIKSSIQSLGANLITVTPGKTRSFGFGVGGGRGTSTTLTSADAAAIKTTVSNVKNMDTELSGRYQLIAKGTNTNTSVMGTTESYTSVRNLEVETGSFITEVDITKMNKVVVIGPTVKTDLFGEDVDNSTVIGQKIRIKNYDFKIIGVTKAKGSDGFNSQDNMVFIPITIAQSYLVGGKTKYVSTVAIQASDEKSMTQIQEDVTALLLERHKIEDSTSADFTVANQTDTVSTMSSITDTFSKLLGAVAAISLIVGGIGIMNMMLTTVTERTREIGLRKAIGAKRRDINNQFLAEAVALTFIGGAIGVILGFIVTFVVVKLGTAAKVSTSSVFLAFGVSALIGVIFGYYPAQRASKLSPIEALKYE